MKEPEILTIDAHCHLFNHEVLSWRLLVDFILSRMRPRGPRECLEAAGGISGLKRIIRFFKSRIDGYGEHLRQAAGRRRLQYGSCR